VNLKPFLEYVENMYQIKTKLMEISASHRLIKNYQGKCRNLHGHNYVIFLTFGCNTLDENDFVLDFSVVKQHCNAWLDDHWDHAIIISSDDQPLLDFAIEQKQKHYVIPEGKNTTVEVLCQHLYEQLSHQVMSRLNSTQQIVDILNVEIWETSTAQAHYHPPQSKHEIL
jgi:6-pyruvoyltetrahydropterin/6-carboxytetrahydropterin synthase